MRGSPGTGGAWTRWIVPAALAAFAAAAIAISTTFDRMPPILKRGIQPSDFPQMVAVLIVALTALGAWREPPERLPAAGRTAWFSMLAFVAFAALSFLDFVLALGATALALAALWGERRPAVLAGVGVLVPLVVFFLFDQAFEVRFPRGVLTNLWYG